MAAFISGVTQAFKKERKTVKVSVQKIKDDLFMGIQEGNFEGVRRIITQNPQLVHIKNAEGQTLLHCAADNNEVDIVELLLQQDADVNAKDNKGRTPLHFAIEWNNIDIIELLIQEGADVKAKNGQNKTPLDCIIEENRSDHKAIKRIFDAVYKAVERVFHAVLLQNYQKRGVDRLGRSIDKIFDGFGRAIYNVITVAAQKSISKQEAIKAFRIAAKILQLEESLEAQKPESISEKQQNKLLHLYEDLYICFTRDNYKLRGTLDEAFSHAPYITKKFPSSGLRRGYFMENFAPKAGQTTAKAIRERVQLERIAAVKQKEKIEAAKQKEKIEVAKQKEKDDFASREMVYKKVKVAFEQSLNSVEKDSPLYQWGLSIYNLIKLAVSLGVLTPEQTKAAFEQAGAVFKREQIGVKTPFAEQACGMSYKEFYTVFNSIADERVRALLLTILGDSPYFQRHYKQHNNSLEDMIQDFSMNFEPLPDDSAKKARDALAIDLYLINRMRTLEMNETISFKEETETTNEYLDTYVFPPRIVYPEETEELYYEETGKTPLYVAVEKGDLEKVKELVGKNPKSIDIADDKSRTPLHIAVERGQLEIAEFLIKKGAAVSAPDYLGKTPLDYAANKKVIELLEKNGATKGTTEVPALSSKKEEEKEEVDNDIVNSRYNDYDEVADDSLHFAVKNEDFEEIKSLLENGNSKIDVQNSFGQTALHIAVQKNRLDIVQLLIEKGAFVHVKDDNGQTPLDYAKKQENREAINLLERDCGKTSAVVPAVEQPKSPLVNRRLSFSGNSDIAKLQDKLAESEKRVSNLRGLSSPPILRRTDSGLFDRLYAFFSSTEQNQSPASSCQAEADKLVNPSSSFFILGQ